MVMNCKRCESPWMNPDENPVIYNTLDNIPIQFCECSNPMLVDPLFSKQEREEIYFLAMSPTVYDPRSRDVELNIDTDILVNKDWLVQREDAYYLTPRGRRLLPLLLTVASDLLQ